MKSKTIYIWSAFAVPVAVIVVVCMANGIILNGDNSILFSDLSNIYADHLMGIKHLISDGKSLIYNWNIGGGINYIPYVFGCLNLTNIPIFITPDSMFQEMILFTQVLRIGLAGVSCYVYLEHHYGNRNVKMIAFSSAYAVSGYSICFIQTISWYESVILLPILVLFAEKLVHCENKLNIKFICVLVYAFFTNYYLGYMISVFLFLYILAYAFKNGISISGTIFRLGLNGIISAGISSIFLFPLFNAILNSGEIANFDIKVKYGAEDIINQIFLGTFDTYKPGGRPLLYCGILTALLIFIYVISDTDDKRSKSADIVLLLVMLSFLVALPLYYIWHMFDNPDWFEGRFTFCIIFYIVTLAYGIGENFLSYKRKDMLIGSFLLCVILFFCSRLFDGMNENILAVNYGLIVAYLFIISVFPKNRLKVMSVSLLMCVELMINAIVCSKVMFAEERCESYSFYNEFYNTNKMAVEYINRNDVDFYRIEKNYFRRENDLGAAGAKALSTFGTFYNVEFMSMLRSLGVTGGQAGRYIGSTPVIDILLSVRYMISYNGYDPFYIPIYTVNDKTIFKSPYNTGIGMLINDGVENLDIGKHDNPIELQNGIVKTWGARNEDVFIPINNYEINMVNLSENTSGNSSARYFEKVNKLEEAYVDIRLKKCENKCLFAYIPNYAGQVVLLLNGMYINEFMGQTNKVINLEKDTFGSEYVTLRIMLDGDTLLLPNNCIYALDIGQLDSWAGSIRYASLKYFSERSIMLNAVCSKNKLLVLSIPFDKDWKVYINGEKQETFPVLQGLTGVKVKEGNNDIRIHFIPKGAKFGRVVSILSIIGLVILINADKKNIETRRN